MPVAKMRISTSLLEALLRLDGIGRIVGASTECAGIGGPVDSVVLEIETDYVPDGAVELSPTYTRRFNVPDPVKIMGVQWTMR